MDPATMSYIGWERGLVQLPASNRVAGWNAVRRSTGGKWYLVQHSDSWNGREFSATAARALVKTDVLLILLMTLLAAVTPCRPEICSFSSHR